MKGLIRQRLSPVPLLCAYFLLVLASIFSNPPGVSPDEYAHYLKALAAGRGDLVLQKRPPPLQGSSASRKELVWQQKQARMVSIPGRLSPDVFSCRAEPNRVEPCPAAVPQTDTELEFRTWVGTYPPFIYLLPGLAMRGATSTLQALYIGRALSAVVSMALLAVAIVVLWQADNPWLSLAGLLAAITPMVVFVASTLSASGPEVAAGISFVACLIAIARWSSRSSRQGNLEPLHPSIWLATAFSGAVLALSRDLGPIWIALDGLILIGWLGLPKTWRIFKEGGKMAWAAVAIISACSLLSFTWATRYQPSPPLQDAFPEKLHISWTYLRETAQQQIGVFGPLDTPLPGWAYFAWSVLAGGLLLLAFLVGSRPRRYILAAAIFTSIVLAVLLDAIQRSVGFGAQGRHLLPFCAGVLLFAGETLFEGKEKLAQVLTREVAFCYLGIASFGHLAAWYTLAHRYSVGATGPLLFFRQQAWAPPLGWATWGVVALAGAMLITIYGVICGPAIAKVSKSQELVPPNT